MPIFRRLLLVIALAVAVTASPVRAQVDSITVGFQGSAYAALPLFVASEKGWWAGVALAPRFVAYAAGPAQIAAAAGRAWDIGVSGLAAAVLGAALADLTTIAPVADEAPAHVVLARADQAEAITRAPQSLRGQQIFLSANTTADMVAIACLRRWSLRRDELSVVNLAPLQIVTAFAAGNGALAVVWGPYNHLLAGRVPVQPLCSGRDGALALPGAVFARAAFLRETPERAVRFLAVYLRAVAWQRANPREALELFRRFSAEGGLELDERAAQAEIEARPLFAIEDVQRQMARTATAPSPFDRAFAAVAAYLRSVAAVRAAPEARAAISDDILRRLLADAALRAVAATP